MNTANWSKTQCCVFTTLGTCCNTCATRLQAVQLVVMPLIVMKLPIKLNSVSYIQRRLFQKQTQLFCLQLKLTTRAIAKMCEDDTNTVLRGLHQLILLGKSKCIANTRAKINTLATNLLLLIAAEMISLQQRGRKLSSRESNGTSLTQRRNVYIIDS